MSEKLLNGNIIVRARLQLGAGDSEKGTSEYFVELPNGELQPINKKDADVAIARSPQMARVIELLIELGKKRKSSSEGGADDAI